LSDHKAGRDFCFVDRELGDKFSDEFGYLSPAAGLTHRLADRGKVVE
jgi:hypothetical protein